MPVPLKIAAIPSGVRAGQLRVTALMYPQLVLSAPAELRDFPEWEHWPATLATLEFTVEIEGQAPVLGTAETVPTAGLWETIFDADLPVRVPPQSRARDAAVGVESFQGARVGSRLMRPYEDAAIEARRRSSKNRLRCSAGN
jgi:hypothetical protein